MDNKILRQLTKKPNPKHKLHNHYQNDKVNQIHQMDLLIITEDQGYKYILTVVDIASRYKSARPLKNKQANTVLEAAKDIYKKMKLPEIIQSDGGSEFKGVFSRWLQDNNIQHQIFGVGSHLPFVESFNNQLTILIFREQQAKELKTGVLNKEFVKSLPKNIKILNERVNSYIKMRPIDAYKLDLVKQKEMKFDEEDTKMMHPVGTKVRYLLKNDEIVDTLNYRRTDKRRSTDILWSIDIYTVSQVLQPSGGLAMHRLKAIDKARKNYLMYNYWELQPI